MKSRILLSVIGVLLAVVLVLLIWSPWKKNEETQNDDGMIRVGIINLDPSESGYRKANVRDMTDTFTAENGYHASFMTAPTIGEQLEAANRFIEDRVQYLLISAADADGWDEVLKKAKKAGVKVLLFDRMINASRDLYTAAVVSDMNREGSTAVAWLESQGLPGDKFDLTITEPAYGALVLDNVCKGFLYRQDCRRPVQMRTDTLIPTDSHKSA